MRFQSKNITKNSSENLTETVEKIEAEKPVVTHPKSVVGDTELEAPILDKKENEFEVLKELEILEIENQLLEQEKAEEGKCRNCVQNERRRP